MVSFPTKTYQKAIHRVMKYCLHTPKCGLKLKPKGVWDGLKDFMFNIKGLSYSEYAKDKSRRSVELPMILYPDNKGAKDFVNKCSIGGHTRHIEVK
eukprot:552512-Ditylum_brightwellii.AAC.1